MTRASQSFVDAQLTLNAKVITLESFAPKESFLQSRLWAEHKQLFGWQPYALRLETNGSTNFTFELMVLLRPLAWGLFLAYVPHGPSEQQAQQLASHGLGKKEAVLAIVAKSVAQAIGKRLLCVRFDLDWIVASHPSLIEDDKKPSWTSAMREELGFLGLNRAPADIQPPDTVVLDLRPTEDELLAAMKAKTRYNIRLSQKKGVLVRVATASELPSWYQLYAQTAERDHIGIHSMAYYQKLLHNNPENCQLLLAEHEGELLAGVILLHFGQRTSYLYGASSNAKRNLMPAYCLQWAAISMAKQRGSLSYDFFGIPPTSDESHPMFGLYQFKTGFGGNILHYAGSWDYALGFLFYRLVHMYESFRFYKERTLSKKK